MCGFKSEDSFEQKIDSWAAGRTCPGRGIELYSTSTSNLILCQLMFSSHCSMGLGPRGNSNWLTLQSRLEPREGSMAGRKNQTSVGINTKLNSSLISTQQDKDSYLKHKIPTSCHFLLYFTSYVLNMFRTLIYPSSGACYYSVELPHWSYCSWLDVCWSFGVVGLEWYPCCRLIIRSLRLFC